MSKRSIARAGLGALAVAGALAAALAAASAEYLGYPDLHEGQWYVSCGLVDWSEERGVVNGVDGEWLPDGPVDRAQAAAILFNYSGDAAPAEGATSDDAGELGWAAAACAWAQDEGVFNGSSNADGTVTMDPWARPSREQAAAVLHDMSGEAAGDPASLDAPPPTAARSPRGPRTPWRGPSRAASWATTASSTPPTAALAPSSWPW